MLDRADFIRDARPIFGTVSTDRTGCYRIAVRNKTGLKKLQAFVALYGAEIEAADFDSFPMLARIVFPGEV